MNARVICQRLHRGWLTVLLLSLLTTLANAAETLSHENLSSYRSDISSDSSLTQESRDQLLAVLDSAQVQLDAEVQFKERRAAFQVDMDTADKQTEKFNTQLEAAKETGQDFSDLLAENASADQISSQITLITAERQALSDRRSQLRKDIDGMAGRRVEIRQRLVELQSQGDRAVPSVTDGNPEQMAKRALAMSSNQAALAEKEALEAEVLSEPDRARVIAAERSWLGSAIDEAEAKLSLLEAALEAARTSATEQQLETTAELQQKLQTQDPVLERFALENRALAEQLQKIDSESDRARNNGLLMQSMLESIEQDSVLMNRRLEVAGRKEILGRVMITRLDSLPDTDRIKREINQRTNLIATTSLTQIDLEEDSRALNERQDYMAQLVPGLDSWDDSSRNLVNGLVDQRAELLAKNLQSLSSLLRQLLDNNEAAVKLIETTDNFHKFLLGNLLWVRNFSFVDMGTFTRQLSVLFSPSQWAQLPAQLSWGYRNESWSTGLLVILLLSLLLRRQLRPVYTTLLSRPVLLSDSSLWHIVAGLALSALLVAPWPLLLYFLGYCLQEAEPASQFSDAMAPALKVGAKLLYILLLTRLITSRQGVGRRFLKWDSRMLDSLRSELNWAGPTICLAFMVDMFAYHLDVVASGGPLGALSTITVACTSIGMGLRLHRQEIFSDDSILRLALRLGVLVALSVIAMLMMGLLFAAETYLIALARSVIFLAMIKVISDALERWLLILRARLERKAREDHRANTELESETHEEPEDLLDVLSLSEAHSKLLALARFLSSAVVLFVIWSPSLPALNLLDSITLWHVTDSANPIGDPRAITLFDMLLSVVILIVTGLVTKHLPSISEVFMREWFNMSGGARYATSILLQYLVIAIGGSLFLSTIGWEWGKVQWLVAAMGVGIGFGLQEIVANFISGIIILFERPVRVGDIISAGGAEGVVKKINPRATIIETFERKEHLIPNKELITGQVINWSLSENAVRVVIPVGIAYGSDVRQALALLLEAATEVTQVLEEPAPRATFEDFGDNALVLWLRCFVSEDRPGAWTELRTIINDKFNDAGIVISFPQRDVHLDTLEPLQLEVRHLSNPGDNLPV